MNSRFRRAAPVASWAVGALVLACSARCAEPVRATVQRVDGSTVGLDVGRRDGVSQGTRFTIFTLGKVIRIPLTSTVTYKEGKPVAVVRVVEVTDMSSTCVVEKREAGAAMAAGMDAVYLSGPAGPAGGAAGGGGITSLAPAGAPATAPASPAGTGAPAALPAPTGVGLAANPSRPAPGQGVLLTVTGLEGGAPGWRVRWSASAGGFSSPETPGASVTWTAPRRTGDHEITAVVTFADGSELEGRGLISVMGEPVVREKVELLETLGYNGFADGQPLSAVDAAFDGAGNAYLLDGRLRYVFARGTGPGAMAGASRKTCADAGLREARALAIGNGKLYVLDAAHPCVKVFGPRDNFESTMGERGKVRDPVDVAVDSRGFAYVADRAACCFHVFNDKGAYLHQRGAKGRGPGQFLAPVAIDVAPNGNIFVLDQARREVQVFDATYSVVGSFECRVTRGNELAGLAVSPDGGTVHVLEGPRSLIASYSIEGKVLSYPAKGDARFPDLPDRASRLAVDGLGRVHVLLRSQRGVHRYTADGRPSGRLGTDEPGKPLGLAVDDNGRFAVLDAQSPHVRLYDSDGWMTTRFAPTTDVPTPFRRPRRIAMTRHGGHVATLGKGGGDGFDSPDKMASLHIFDPAGKCVRALGQRGTQPGEFLEVVDLDTDRRDDIHTLDRKLFRISVFGLEGVGLTPERERQLNRGARLPHELVAPGRIAIDPDTGDMYVYDAKTRLVKKYTKDVVYIGMTTPDFGLRDVERMRVDNLGLLWVFDRGLRELRRIDFTGNMPKLSSALALGDIPGGAVDFGVDARGQVYVLGARDLIHVYR